MGFVLAGVWMLLVAFEPVIDVAAAAGVTCPAAEEVSAKLQPLSPTGASSPPRSRDVVTLEEDAAFLHVTLRAADGTVLGKRRFDRAYSCNDLASAVALAVATWESDVHPEFVLTPPRETTESRARDLTAAASPAPAGPAPRGGTAVVVQQGRTAEPRRDPQDESAHHLDFGAALLAQLAPGRTGGSFEAAAVPGLAMGAGWVPGGRGFGVRLSIGTTTERTLVLAEGEARWRRVSAIVGPQFRWSARTGRTTFDLHGGVAAAALNLRGVRFWTNQNEWTLDMGASAGGRVWLGTGRWRPSVELSFAVWPREHVLYARASEATATLPRAEVLLSFALAFVVPRVGPSLESKPAPVQPAVDATNRPAAGPATGRDLTPEP